MHRMRAPIASKIVLLGMMTRIPVAGVVWQTVHYLLGFERLGYEVYYVEAHARTPAMLMEREEDDSSARAAAFIDRVMRRFGLGDRWAFHALHDDGRCFGMSELAAARASTIGALLLINLHGGTEPLPELYATDRLVYLETDPVQLQIELHDGPARRRSTSSSRTAPSSPSPRTSAHRTAACRRRTASRSIPTRQPVVLDFWRGHGARRATRFTTVGNWRQPWRDVELRRRALQLEQAPRVPEVHRPAARTGAAVRAGAVELRARRQARCSRARAGRCATRSTSRPTPTPTATTSPARAASSRSPRTRTCGCAPAGSATAARPTWPPGGR